ncbi:methyltransferase domain-containing protein [Poseidonibacter lekithochrous]|uniref:methyltransferase domain-containing protein n=1 Tax=Poseidonibacter TaxID=2321187 RepID=UPI001C0A0DA1|nr:MULTISPECIES: methyltransferase domain-containing protein [Poseidonibacter]MBU3014239.1 methyltransferase domain-containing protein [Poseidonibacter lekithochrous]MDO6827536.1 methyltransferase domain-containing protein [Poseidonibacter sp. 1_MG-2023]
MTVEEIIKKIKVEAKNNQKDEPSSLQDIPENDFQENKTKNTKEIFYSLDDFTKYHDEEFINNAYQGILNRKADESGKSNYLTKLREGDLTKEEIVALIHFSEEGQQQNISIKNTKIIYLLTKGYKVPFLGYILKTFVLLATLPKLLKQITKNEGLREIESIKQEEKHDELIKKFKMHSLDTKLHLKEQEEDLFNQEIKLKEFKNIIEKNLSKVEIGLQETNISKEHLTELINEAKKRLPLEPFNKEEVQRLIEEENHLFDALYVNFENEFRGTKEDIKNKVKVYLPYLENLPFDKETINSLDVGCGRGEWIELLNENGYKNTTGIDLNRMMVLESKELNLDVKEADVIAHLKSLKSDSLALITGFHIIEHLPFDTLMSVFVESFRVLKKEGMIIFETPNPRNILVGSSDFYLDPTHKNPIHPLTLKFLVRQAGFTKVDSMILDDEKLTNFEDLQFNDINDYINIGRDLSVIAYK